MAYIGRQPITGQFEKQQLTADSSTTSFALDWSVGSESALIVSVGGVLQEPGTAYTLSGGGTNIVFTAAPTTGDRVYIHFLGQAIVQNLTDLNGTELILDANANTSITADTDDQIDIKISGADDFQFTANTFTSLSGSTIKTNTIAETTSTSGVTIDGVLLKDGKVDQANSIDSDAYIDGSIDLAHMSVNSIDSDQYVDGSIDTAHLADNQVTLAKMAGITRGSIIIGNASGDPAALGVGSSGQALTSDGTDISWGAAGAITSYTNSSNNRVVTSVDSTTVNSEANLTFDGSTLAVTGAATVSTTLGVTGILTGSAAIIGTTVEPTGDTSASDNAAIGYTAAEGLILTGQGSTNDVTIKNDADGTVMSIPTGTTGVTFAGTIGSGAITSTGVITGTGFTIGSAAILEAELEILDGASVTTTELNLIDGGTARGTDALASGDGILINDAGTMKMTNVDTVKTFMQSGLSSFDPDGAVTFNDTGADVDFRVESDDNTHMIFVDGGEDHVTIGSSADKGAIFNVDAATGTLGDAATIYHSGNNQGLRIEQENASYPALLRMTSQGGQNYDLCHDNSNNMYLQYNGTKNWQANSEGAISAPLQPAFMAVPTGTTTWNMQQQAAMPFSNEIFDQGADYNNSTYTFTAPVTGRYQLSATFDTQNLDSSADWWNLAIATSNRGYGTAGNSTMWSADLGYYGMPIACTADMDANDTAFMQFYQANGANQIKMGVFGGGHFGGILIA